MAPLMAQPQGRLVLALDIGGTIARQQIADDLVRRLDAHPLYRVLSVAWVDGMGEERQVSLAQIDQCRDLGLTINDRCPDCGERLFWAADDDGYLTMLTCLDGCGWSCRAKGG